MRHKTSMKFKFVSINKVLLEPRHAHLFTYCVWLLSCYKSRVVAETTDPGSLKYSLYGPLYDCWLWFGRIPFFLPVEEREALSSLQRLDISGVSCTNPPMPVLPPLQLNSWTPHLVSPYLSTPSLLSYCSCPWFQCPFFQSLCSFFLPLSPSLGAYSQQKPLH